MKTNIIYNEDCIGEKGMKILPNRSIDMILADPPYEKTVCKWDTIIPLEPLWRQLKRIIKPNGAIVLTASQPFTTILIASNMKMLRHQWVWNKNNSAGFPTVKIRPFIICEDILVFGENRVNYYPQMERRGKPRNKRGYSISDNYGIIPTRINKRNNLYYPKNLLNFPNASQKGKVHPTQKPVALMEYLIKTYTNEGEIVLDFAMGSGTTAVACISLNRYYIGFETNKKYWRIAEARLKAKKNNGKRGDK